MTHGTKSGVAHFVAQNEYECMDYIKSLNYHTFLKIILKHHLLVKTSDDPNRLDNNLINIVPEDSLQPYDMKEIILFNIR